MGIPFTQGVPTQDRVYLLFYDLPQGGHRAFQVWLIELGPGCPHTLWVLWT